MSWKIVAIIFILLFLIETGIFAWIFYVGNQYIQDEENCSYGICLGYDSFYFDDSTNMCYCYQNNEITKQEYVK